MRITIVIAGLGGGGAERVAVNLANAWFTRGYSSALLTISQNAIPPAYKVDDGVDLRDIVWHRRTREYELNARAAAPIMRGFYANDANILTIDLPMLAALRFAILKTEPDVVVSFITQTNVRVLSALYESKVPVIVNEVSDARRLYIRDWTRLRERFYRHAAHLVAPDPLIAEWFTASGVRATSIHNPLEHPVTPIPTNSTARKRVITLSRMSSEKRVEWIVRAFAAVAERYPDWDLEIYGNGPQRNFLEHLAEDLAPPGRIRICGFSREAFHVLGGADIYVSASWIEGFGNSIWEALACGVPVIAIDAGPSIARLVRHEVDGLVVRDDSVRGRTIALERLMKNEDERKTFASNAPKVVERFSMRAALQQWDELLSLFRTR